MITEVNGQVQKGRAKNSSYTKNILVQKVSNSLQKIEAVNLSAMDAVLSDILSCKIQIPDKEKPFQLIVKDQNEYLQKQKIEEMHKILQKKQQIHKELKKIESEQFKLLMSNSILALNNSRPIDTKTNNHIKKNFKSEATPQDRQKINQILKSHRKFIKRLEQKQKLYQQSFQTNRINNIQIQENLKKNKCEQRRKYLEKLRLQINIQQQERREKHKKQTAKLLQVKKQKKLYQKLEQSWRAHQNQNQQKIKQEVSQIKQNLKLSPQMIKEHQIEYDKFIMERQEKRLKKQEQQKESLKISLYQLPKSKFYNLIQSQKRRNNEQSEQRERKKSQLINRKLQYSTKVKEDFKPKVDESLKLQLIRLNKQNQQQIDKRLSMPLGEIQNIGNKYMKQIHHMIDVNKSKALQKQKIDKLQQMKRMEKRSYHNYLIPMKNKRKTQNVGNRVTWEVTQIMKNDNLSINQKFQRTKQMAKKLQVKSNHRSSELIMNISEKIKILQALINQ